VFGLAADPFLEGVGHGAEFAFSRAEVADMEIGPPEMQPLIFNIVDNSLECGY
jgi:hypothetical protein